MKKIVLVFVMGLITVSPLLASGTPNLSKELNQKVSIDLNEEGLEVSNKDFVKVSFTIRDGEIVILEMNSTQEGLRDLIIRELEEIHVQSEYGFNQTYYYKFTFAVK